MISKNLIITMLDLKTNEEVIELLANLLVRGGYVNKGFKKAVTERERKSPTGLSTGENGFAIPHTDTSYVVKSAIAIGILNYPVQFNEMGDPQNKVKVDIVVMPAIKNPDKVVLFLKEICLILQDKNIVAGLHACKKAEEAKALLINRNIL